MGQYLPPYANKHLNKCKSELAKAENKENKAKAKYEEAQEYTKLCRERLTNATK